MAIYIKPMTWAGETRFYVGHEPSNPTADPASRLGACFISVGRIESARAIAAHEAQRLSTSVVECPHYVGFERTAANLER